MDDFEKWRALTIRMMGAIVNDGVGAVTGKELVTLYPGSASEHSAADMLRHRLEGALARQVRFIVAANSDTFLYWTERLEDRALVDYVNRKWEQLCAQKERS